jgi:hypothetical protein
MGEIWLGSVDAMLSTSSLRASRSFACRFQVVNELADTLPLPLKFCLNIQRQIPSVKNGDMKVFNDGAKALVKGVRQAVKQKTQRVSSVSKKRHRRQTGGVKQRIEGVAIVHFSASRCRRIHRVLQVSLGFIQNLLRFIKGGTGMVFVTSKMASASPQTNLPNALTAAPKKPTCSLASTTMTSTQKGCPEPQTAFQ